MSGPSYSCCYLIFYPVVLMLERGKGQGALGHGTALSSLIWVGCSFAGPSQPLEDSDSLSPAPMMMPARLVDDIYALSSCWSGREKQCQALPGGRSRHLALRANITAEFPPILEVPASVLIQGDRSFYTANQLELSARSNLLPVEKLACCPLVPTTPTFSTLLWQLGTAVL